MSDGKASIVTLLVGTLTTYAAAHVVGARALGDQDHRRDRFCAALLIAPLACIAQIRLLGAIGLLSPAPLQVAIALTVAVAFLASGSAARQRAWSDVLAVCSTVRGLVRSDAWAPALVGAVALLTAALSAYLMSPWAWDALGYHLPVVYDALQTGSLRHIPTHLPDYINAYPHAVEHAFLWAALLLPADTWIDFAQAPFGIACAAATAAFARRGGAGACTALGFGLLTLAVPVLALQLATNYVDVAFAAFLMLAAYFATAPVTRASSAFTGLGLALLLATKPSAPPAAFVLFATLAWRAVRAGKTANVSITAGVALLGAKSYVQNTWAHHNPVWPAAFHLGLLRLPGIEDVEKLYTVGLPATYQHASWARRLIGSWLTLRPVHYIYDMRLGGFGPLFPLVLLPALAFLFASRKHRAHAATFAPGILASLATPAAFWSRYTLALPLFGIAALSAIAQTAPALTRRAIPYIAAALAAFAFVDALPGFTSDAPGYGPSLVALWKATPYERARLVSADGAGRRWEDAKASLAAGEAFAYDRSFGLPGELWRFDRASRVVYVPDEIRDHPAQLLAWLTINQAPLVVLGDDSAILQLPAADVPKRLEPLFRCPTDPCAVYRVRERAATMWRPDTP